MLDWLLQTVIVKIKIILTIKKMLPYFLHWFSAESQTQYKIKVDKGG
jgi:hypothetical protein